MGSPPVLTSETLARNKKEMSLNCKLCSSAHIHPPLQINSNPHKLSLKMRLYNEIPLTFASQITIHKFTNNRYICDPSSVGALLVAPHLHKWRETMVSTQFVDDSCLLSRPQTHKRHSSFIYLLMDIMRGAPEMATSAVRQLK